MEPDRVIQGDRFDRVAKTDVCFPQAFPLVVLNAGEIPGAEEIGVNGEKVYLGVAEAVDRARMAGNFPQLTGEGCIVQGS